MLGFLFTSHLLRPLVSDTNGSAVRIRSCVCASAERGQAACVPDSVALWFQSVCSNLWSAFLIGLLVSLLLSFESSLYILDASPLSGRYVFPEIFLSVSVMACLIRKISAYSCSFS